MYKVTSDLKLKVQGVIKVFLAGSVIKLPEKSAQIFIQQGKIVPIPEEPQITRNNEPTERDRELERYIGKPSLNPNGYNCITCGAIGERYCLAFSNSRWWWGWQCLKCRPYNEPERN